MITYDYITDDDNLNNRLANHWEKVTISTKTSRVVYPYENMHNTEEIQKSLKKKNLKIAKMNKLQLQPSPIVKSRYRWWRKQFD